jgi:hypothetical protein
MGLHPVGEDHGGHVLPEQHLRAGVKSYCIDTVSTVWYCSTRLSNTSHFVRPPLLFAPMDRCANSHPHHPVPCSRFAHHGSDNNCSFPSLINNYRTEPDSKGTWNEPGATARAGPRGTHAAFRNSSLPDPVEPTRHRRAGGAPGVRP